MSQKRFERRQLERQKDGLPVAIGAMCLADGTVRERLLDGDHVSPLRQLTVGELQLLGVIE